jgi:mRNA interferase MazF
MTNFSRGDVVVDLGMAAKVRPRVVLSVSNPDRQRPMSLVVPLTMEIRGGECEIRFPKPAGLRQESVVNVLGIAGVDNAKIERRIAAFPAGLMAQLELVLERLLGLSVAETKNRFRNASRLDTLFGSIIASLLADPRLWTFRK